MTAAANNPTLQVWDVSSQRLKEASSSDREAPHQSLNSHTGAVSFLTFSPDSQFLVSGSSDKTIIILDGKNLIDRSLVPNSVELRVQVWDVKTGKVVHRSPNITWRANLDVSPDGKTYVTAGVGAIFEIRDLMTDEVIKDFGTEENVALFSPDGQSLMTQGSEGTRIWR